MGAGPLWEKMNARPRRSAAKLVASDVPHNPGVYAWYRNGRPIYVGKAKSLHQRVWKNHTTRNRSAPEAPTPRT